MKLTYLLCVLCLFAGAARAEWSALDRAPAAATGLDHIAAVVDEDVILASEVEETLRGVRAQLREKAAQLPDDAALRRQVLERLILNKLQLALAERTGIRVDDDTVTAALGNIASQNKLSLREFKAALERDGYSFERFRGNVREQIMISRLQQRQVGNLVTVSEQEVENYLKGRSGKGDAEQEYHLAHILVALPEGSTPEKIEAARAKAERLHAKLAAGADFAQLSAQESNAQQALEGGDLGWRSAAQIPTLFAEVVRKLQPGAVSEVVRSPSGFHLIRLIETRGLGQHVVEQMELRAGELADKDELRERLHQLKARIEAGEDFAALARANSQDPATASQGGALGWLSPGELPPPFAEAVGKLAPGVVSEPFETEIGLHIAQIVAKRRHDDSDAYRRSVARDQIRARKAEEELEVWLRRLRDEAYVEYRDGAG